MASFFFIFILPHYGIHVSGEYAGVWRGVFGNKNNFGGAMILSVTIFLICPTYTEFERLSAYFLSLMALFAAIMSESKSALVVLIGMLAVMLCVRIINGKGIKTISRTAMLLMFGIGTAVLMTKYTSDILIWIGKDDTLTGRTDTWNIAWDRALDRPVLGYGYRAFWTDKNPARRGPTESWRDEIGHAHNTYLDLLLELGFFGCTVFALLLGTLCVRLIARCMKIGDCINIWLFVILFYILARGVVEVTILQQADITWVLFSYMYVYLAIYRWQLPLKARPDASKACDGVPVRTRLGVSLPHLPAGIDTKPDERDAGLSGEHCEATEPHSRGYFARVRSTQSPSMRRKASDPGVPSTGCGCEVPRLSRTGAQAGDG